MALGDINFGDIDAKNEILKERRSGKKNFFESFYIPERVNIDRLLSGETYFIQGLKGTGKTALLRYLKNIIEQKGDYSQIILFKSEISEGDRQSLSENSGYEIISTGGINTFHQDFKEAWKYLIHQRIASVLKNNNTKTQEILNYLKITGAADGTIIDSIGGLLSRISAQKITLGNEALGVAVELGISPTDGGSALKTADLNRACDHLLNAITIDQKIYILFDELELFHESSEQFDRDRRIIRDLIFAIAQMNANFSENHKSVFICSTLRSEVLHSILELGHEVGRDIDDFGVTIDWSEHKSAKDHPLLKLIGKKIAQSTKEDEDGVWERYFPEKINNQDYHKFILNTSYFRPRDIVRLLSIARDYDPSAEKFTTAHFDYSSTAFSKQTWLEITEELLATYSNDEIASLHQFLLGFNAVFFRSDIEERLSAQYSNNRGVQSLFQKHGIDKILSDLFRIGVVGNDFVMKSSSVNKRRQRWIFRGNTTLNTSERMAIHKSLRKHLSLFEGNA